MPPDSAHAGCGVLAQLEARLAAAAAPYELLRHRPVFTSAEAAAERGTSLSSGAKALVCKADEQFLMFVLPADRKLASKSLRQAQRWRSLRFANPDEVLEKTGLTPGSIPPFGSLFALDTWCDRRLLEEPRINFNAGDHAVSICLATSEYLRVEQPRIERLSED